MSESLVNAREMPAIFQSNQIMIKANFFTFHVCIYGQNEMIKILRMELPDLQNFRLFLIPSFIN